MRQTLRPSMWLFLALALAGAFGAGPAGAWRREFRGTNTTFDAHASAVVLDGAGDVIATGQVANVGTGTAFTVAKLDGATGAEIWRTEINGTGAAFNGAGPVVVDGAGDVVAAGTLENVPNRTDFAVVKLAGATGAELWRYERHGTPGGSGVAHAIALDGSGDVVAAGRIINSPGLSTFTVVKLAGATGAELWRDDLTSSPPQPDDFATAVAVDSAGDVLAAGHSDFSVVKLAGATGAELWRGAYSSPRASAVTVDGADDVVVAGTTLDGGVGDYVVVKFAGTTGTEVWRYVTFGVASFFGLDGAFAIAVDGAGDVVSAGQIDNIAAPPGHDTDFAVIKIAGATGAELWRREINGTTTTYPPQDSVHAVALDGTGDVFAAGVISNRNILVQGPDFAVVKLDGATGAVEWQQTLQGASTVAGVVDAANGVVVDGTGAAIVAGYLTNRVSTADFTVVRLGALDGAVGPLRALKLTVRDRAAVPNVQALIAVAADRAVVAPAPGTAGDPTLFGATLRLVNPGTPETATIPLPALHWTASGGTFEYRDQGTCRIVRVRPGRDIKMRCTGIPFSLDEPAQGTLALSLQLGGADRQCVIMGGAAVVRDVGITGPTSTGVFRARNADPPSADCP